MIWQNAWAWLGLFALAVPILIHLLARRSARVQRFPTLRFLEASRLLPRRRTRLSDLLLLAVRLAILVAAVVALAQPLWLTTDRERDLGRALARAIIVDTSASMMRQVTGGERALDGARREARRVAGEAQTSVILESAEPAQMLAGAVAWLRVQAGRHEVVIVSDFQIGTFDSRDLAVVSEDIGVHVTRMEVSPTSAPIERATRHGKVESIARIVLEPERTNVAWTVREPLAADASAVLLLAGSSERERADAAHEAALTTGAPNTSNRARGIAVVYPQFEQRAQLARAAKPLDQPWMADVVVGLRRDSMLVAAALNADVKPDPSLDTARFVVVARTQDGHPVAVAARGEAQGRDRLLLFLLADAGSLASAALIAAAAHASSDSPPIAELEPSTLSDRVLQSWQRVPSPVATPRGDNRNGASDGRWFWLLALALLGVETWMRRARREFREAPTEVTVYERVA